MTASAAGKVRFGVIGTGGMGSGHCKMIPEIPETTLTAICDIDPATRERITTQIPCSRFRHASGTAR